jgi:glycosyltransferase involved in cell wall biosynthesis
MGPLRRILVPPGSRRDRLAWIALVTVRKMREGPGPWLRAVRKGVFQLLPRPLRERILRWSGEERFFRRHEVRHVGADGGVERQGLVSVVLPVFDQADLIAESIDSVLAQSYAPIELIVLDDGSRDDVQTALRRYAGDTRVRLLAQPNQGLPKALSTAFESATGEFFCWTSADNRMHPEQLARLVAHLRARPDLAMVWADYRLIDDRGRPLVGGEFRVLDRTDPKAPDVVRTKRFAEDLNRYEDNYVGPCFLYRGRVGRLLGDYNPELGLEDYDYWMRINRLFRLEHLGADDVLYEYRVHDNTLSARARELRILERAKALMAYERRRAAWVGAPLRVLADEPSRRWLAGVVQAPDVVAPLPDASAWPTDKALAMVDGASLPAVAAAPPPANVAVAACFADVAAVHRAAAALRALPCLALAADAEVAARLAVHRREVAVAAAGAEAYGLAVRYAANATFFRSTRDAQRLARAVPRPVVAAPPSVLLQVESVGRGGLERVVFDLAAELLADGCRVGLLALDGGAPALDLPPELVALERLRLPRRDVAAYRDLLAAGAWQVVDAHACVFGAEAAAAAGALFVQTVHNSYVWFDRAAVEAMRAADAHTAAYVCVSAQALGYLDLRLGLDVAKALVIENGIAETPAAGPATRAAARGEFGVADEEPLFLMVASIQPAKAHRAAAHAFAAVRTALPGARLLCVGAEMHPILAVELRRDLEQLGLREAVVLAGHRDDLSACHAAADAFVLPSYWEGCSLSVWEAVAAGLPLVLSDVGAAAEQLRWGHGELVSPPFADVFTLDAANLQDVVGPIDAEYVARLAAAMVRAAGAPRRPRALPVVARRRTMASRTRALFDWLRQGGSVPGARTLVARGATAGEAVTP